GSCGVHGHQHDIARKSSIPVSDEQAFWGVLGCSACLLIPDARPGSVGAVVSAAGPASIALL
ncbi:hypothetical protein CKJ90_22910, partial [Klebsiella pneumoniae]